MGCKSLAFKKLASLIGVDKTHSFNLEQAKDQSGKGQNLTGNEPLVDMAKLVEHTEYAEPFAATPAAAWDQVIEIALQSGEDEDRFLQKLEDAQIDSLQWMQADKEFAKEFASGMFMKIIEEHKGHSSMSRQFMQEVLDLLDEWTATPESLKAIPEDAFLTPPNPKNSFIEIFFMQQSAQSPNATAATKTANRSIIKYATPKTACVTMARHC